MSEIYLEPLQEILVALEKKIQCMGLSSKPWRRSQQKNYQHLHQAKMETQILIGAIV